MKSKFTTDTWKITGRNRSFQPDPISMKALLISVAIGASVFLLDLLSPLGVAGGALYVLLVITGRWFHKKTAPIYLAAISSILTILGYFLSPEGGIDWVVLVNRIYALVAIWSMAILIFVHSKDQIENSIQTSHKQRHGLIDRIFEKENLFVAALSVLILFFAWGAILSTENTEKRDIAESLESTLGSAHATIHNQLTGQKKRAIGWASNPELLNAAKKLSTLAQEANALTETPTQQRLRSIMKPIFNTLGYRGFFIIGKNNINIGSSRDENVGTVNLLAENTGFLERIWAGETLHSQPQPSDVPLYDINGDLVDNLATMFVATPIKNDNDIIAILALRLEPEIAFYSIFTQSHFGASGATYAFNSNGRVISGKPSSKFLQHIELKNEGDAALDIEARDKAVNLANGKKSTQSKEKHSLTPMAISAITGERGLDLTGYSDYRGTAVVGAWLWDDELEFGIATEISIEEAYASFNNTRNVIIILSLLSVVVLVFFAIHSNSARQKLFVSEENYRSLYNSMEQGVIYWNSSDVITAANPAALSILGLSKHQLGERESSLSDSQNLFEDGSIMDDASRPATIALTTGKSVLNTKMGIHNKSSGKTIWLSVHAIPQFREGENKPYQVYSMFSDITEQRKSEQLLADNIRELNFQKHALDSHAIVSMVDSKGNFIYANEKFCEITGYQLEDFIGKQSTFFESGNHPKDFYDQLRMHVSKGKIWHGELNSKNKAGEIYWVTTTIVPFMDKNNSPFQFATIQTDITERKNAEETLAERESRYRFFIENVDEGIIIFDHGSVVDVSSRWCELFRCEMDDAIGRAASYFTAPYEWDRVQHAIESNNDAPYEADLLRFDGTTFTALIRGHNVIFDDRNVRLTTILDISEQKETEAALIEAKQQADKASQAKSDFLSSMSHELRTPMNAILGFGQLLEMDSEKTLSKNQKDYINLIINGGNHLLELINDILDLAQIESGKVELVIENISLTKLLDECLILMQVVANNKGIDLAVTTTGDTPENVYADRTRLKQVLINLISNAIKYNREDGKVQISIEKTVNRTLRINISDQGRGISNSDQEKLFKPFSRVGDTKTEIEGTGIGLAVSRDLVQLMNGFIGVESTVGNGATFWVELPLAAPTLMPKRKNENSINKLDKRYMPPSATGTILYVEDSPTNIVLLEGIVSHIKGVVLITALNGKDGIKLASIKTPDLIILDINLPDMNGIDVLKAIRKNDNTKNTPVFAMSAAATQEDIKLGKEAGFQQYITKPIKIPVVFNTISEALNDIRRTT